MLSSNSISDSGEWLASRSVFFISYERASIFITLEAVRVPRTDKVMVADIHFCPFW